MKHQWSEEETAALKRMFSAGKTPQEMSLELGNATNRAISRKLVRLGLLRDRTPRFKWSAELLERFRALYSAGVTYKAIADELSLPNSQTAINQARYLGLHRGRVQSPPAEPNQNRVVRDLAHDEKLFRERYERRNAPVRDLSAAFFGDPPVGYSALEKRA